LEEINTLIYGPTLMQRERIPFAERFHRMEYALKTVDLAASHLKSDEEKNQFYTSINALFKAPLSEIGISPNF
jgi:hypothetical protein